MSKKKKLTNKFIMETLKGIKLKENRILIERFSNVVKTPAGIILPEEDQKAPEGGTIVAVGPCAKINIEVGTKVRFLQHGMEVLIDDKPYYLLRDTDIWCEIE